jgi:hypothetical protein
MTQLRFTETGTMQFSINEVLHDRLASPRCYPLGRFAGRGIVICAGGPQYFTCAWILIWLIRRVHGSTLPIQVWYLSRAEMSDQMRLILEEEEIEVVDAEVVTDSYPARIVGGWPLKPYAIAHSRFQEVLYLDADTVPFIDPQVVFDWQDYRNNGTLFWPDIIDLKRENPVWNKVGLEPRDCVSFETGAIVIDKRRAWEILDIAILLNEHWNQLYDLIYGDKDTFLLSCLLLNRPYGLIRHRPFKFDGDLVQREPSGDLFFHHRTRSKWNFLGRNHPVATATLTDACEQALKELRRRWTGAVFHAPWRSQRALAEEAALIAARRVYYQTSAITGRIIELLSAGRIGEGRAELEQHWTVVERCGSLVLQLFSDFRLGVELTKLDDGTWQGASVTGPGFTARLSTEHARQSWPYTALRQVPRSAENFVAVLLDPAFLSVGFEPETARELRAALTLLNRMFDDVPEQVSARVATVVADALWRRNLEDLAVGLVSRRDAQVARTEPSVDRAIRITSNHYRRAT